MKNFNIAVLGCGTVGSGAVKILLESNNEVLKKSGYNIRLKKIVDIFPKKVSEKYNIPIELFSSNKDELNKDEIKEHIQQVITSDEIDLVIETIGGSSDEILNIVIDILKAKKHLVTANKALLAIHGKKIFKTAKENNVVIGYEASVCGAIPIIKTVMDSFVGDEIITISGIMNGTSNYILSKMQEERINFKDALARAQKKGYAELDPALDISGKDAGHKLVILIKLAFGVDINFNDLSINGIQDISIEDIDFANEMDSNIKLICFAEKKENQIFACVKPMMVKRDNLLSKINGVTNAIQLINKYAGKHVLIGKGAGSFETASSIIADIIYIARYSEKINNEYDNIDYNLIDQNQFTSPYNITFETEDFPGITGLITTAIGNQKINIDTVSHNRHNKEKAVFSIATMACTLGQIVEAVKEIQNKNKNILIKEPKICPILY